jgi:hypothetical protein
MRYRPLRIHLGLGRMAACAAEESRNLGAITEEAARVVIIDGIESPAPTGSRCANAFTGVAGNHADMLAKAAAQRMPMTGFAASGNPARKSTAGT